MGLDCGLTEIAWLAVRVAPVQFNEHIVYDKLNEK